MPINPGERFPTPKAKVIDEGVRTVTPFLIAGLVITAMLISPSGATVPPLVLVFIAGWLGGR